MRVNRFGETPGFKEFDVTFTIENEEEARALYAIFNYFPNVYLLGDGEAAAIRSAIGEGFSKLPSGSVISNGVTYREFYRSKSEGEQ